MSRTYRRKGMKLPEWKNRKYFKKYEELDLSILKTVHERETGYSYRYMVSFKEDSKEYKKLKAKYHSDNGTERFKEPGPMWFIRKYSQVPYRVKCKNELAKYKKYIDHEIILESMPKLDYWT